MYNDDDGDVLEDECWILAFTPDIQLFFLHQQREPHGRLWSSNPNLSKLVRSLTSLHLFQTVVGDNRWGDAWHYIGSKTENHFHQNSKIHWSYEVAGVVRPFLLVGVLTSKGFQAVPGVGMNTFNCQTGKSKVSDNRRNSAD